MALCVGRARSGWTSGPRGAESPIARSITGRAQPHLQAVDFARFTNRGGSGIINAVATQPHVTLSGDINGDYLVEDRRPDGRLVLIPDSEIAYPAVMPSFSGRPATAEELQALLGDLTTDGEG